MAKISEHIYLGSYITASDEKQLDDLKIGCVINVAKKCQNMFPKKFDYIFAPFDDDSYIPKDIIDAVVDLMHQYVSKKINVFVHCRMGKSRSVFTIAYYLTKYSTMEKNGILTLIKSKKNDINMSPIFEIQLDKYDPKNKLDLSDFPDALIKRVRTTIDDFVKEDERKKKLFNDITNEIIKETIVRHKRVREIENFVKLGKRFPKGSQVIYPISLIKKTNFSG
jgi:hypothetical protein